MSSNYNLRERPAEILIRNGQPYLIRKRETLNDLLGNIIDLWYFIFIRKQNGFIKRPSSTLNSL